MFFMMHEFLYFFCVALLMTRDLVFPGPWVFPPFIRMSHNKGCCGDYRRLCHIVVVWRFCHVLFKVFTKLANIKEGKQTKCKKHKHQINFTRHFNKKLFLSSPLKFSKTLSTLISLRGSRWQQPQRHRQRQRRLRQLLTREET